MRELQDASWERAEIAPEHRWTSRLLGALLGARTIVQLILGLHHGQLWIPGRAWLSLALLLFWILGLTPPLVAAMILFRAARPGTTFTQRQHAQLRWMRGIAIADLTCLLIGMMSVWAYPNSNIPGGPGLLAVLFIPFIWIAQAVSDIVWLKTQFAGHARRG